MSLPAPFRLAVKAVLLSFLPGLALAAAPAGLASLTEIQCTNFQAQLAGYEKQFAARMSDWSRKEMPDLQGRDVLYLFSGPDVVTALALFPEAAHVTLVADQKPEYALLGRAEEAPADKVARECSMIGFFSRLGYYRTNDLNGLGGAKPHFIKLLVYSIAFAGATVTDASLLAVAPGGELQSFAPGDARRPQGLRFEARRRDGRPVTIDYLVVDLSNAGLKGDARATAWLRRVNSDVLFLKSASHLLQSPHFSTLADLLTTPASPFLVQDETGFGVDRLHANYGLTHYGRFTTPQTLWARNPSARAFAEEFAQHAARPLPFRIGYEKESGSALLVGRRTVTTR
ncbi:MAG: hypothetical protein ACKOEC_18455 [Acidimicrobiia bacterium]